MGVGFSKKDRRVVGIRGIRAGGWTIFQKLISGGRLFGTREQFKARKAKNRSNIFNQTSSISATSIII